jgi:dienelactone hydrolase
MPPCTGPRWECIAGMRRLTVAQASLKIEVESAPELLFEETIAMQWLSRGRWCVVLVIVATLAGTQTILAQGGAEKVRFDTYDRVTIRGTFYASSKGSKAPCVILLHPIGGSSAQEGWEGLAKKLQEKGFAVLAFDFRGHGDSKEVDPAVFWKYPLNAKLKGFTAAKPRSEISYKEFTTPYHYLALVNDIAAARRYLDTRNDSQECNAANIIVIGAESGATLGALWMATEWQRRLGAQTPPFSAKGPVGGQEINCAVWLTINPTVAGNYKAPVESWLRMQQVREKIPMYFLYGADDNKTERYIQHLYNDVLRAKTDKKLSKLTGIKGVEGTKLSGRDLLTKGLATQDLIVKYVEKVIADNGMNAYERRGKSDLYPVPFENYLK